MLLGIIRTMSDEQGANLYSVEKMWLRHWDTAIHKKPFATMWRQRTNGEQIVHRQWDPSDTRQRVRSLLPYPLFQVIKKEYFARKVVERHVDDGDGMKRPVIDSLGRNYKGMM